MTGVQTCALPILIVLTVIVLLSGEPLTWYWLLAIPALALQAVFNVGMGLSLARLGAGAEGGAGAGGGGGLDRLELGQVRLRRGLERLGVQEAARQAEGDYQSQTTVQARHGDDILASTERERDWGFNPAEPARFRA